MRNTGKLKNLVSSKSRHLEKQLRGKFNASTNLVYRALMGDQKALKLIGQMGNDGTKISEFAPKVKENMLAAIKGAEDLNTTLAAIYKQAGVSGERIEREIQSATLADDKLANQLEELNLDFEGAKSREELRHKQAKEHITLKAWVDRHMMSIDGEYKMLQEELKTEVRQQTIDLQHDKELGNYYLDAGDNARDDLKPKKQYAGRSIIQKIKDTILGF